MLTVAILVNGQPIYSRTAVNMSQQYKGKTRYDLDDGSIIWHNPKRGAVELATRMLKTIKEVKQDAKGDETKHREGE